jgi:hypothetical protein
MFLLSLTATCQVCTVSLKAGLYTYNRFTGRALDTPDGETTQPETGIVGVAGQAPALAAAGLVEELKAEREEKREHELDKCLGVTEELKVRRLVLKIDGDGPVVACRLRPTVSLDVMALVAGSCGYYRGHLEHRAAQ